MINFNILVDKYVFVWYNTGKDRWDWQGGETLKWREMSYNQPKLTMRQRLDVEPEELDDYPEWQFEKDVATDEFDESSISLFMRYQYILPTRWARDSSAHGQDVLGASKIKKTNGRWREALKEKIKGEESIGEKDECLGWSMARVGIQPMPWQA